MIKASNEVSILLIAIVVFLMGIMFMIHDVAVAIRELLEVLQ